MSSRPSKHATPAKEATTRPTTLGKHVQRAGPGQIACLVTMRCAWASFSQANLRSIKSVRTRFVSRARTSKHALVAVAVMDVTQFHRKVAVAVRSPAHATKQSGWVMFPCMCTLTRRVGRLATH